MTALSDARAEVVAALAGVAGASVHEGPPRVLSAPALIVRPGDPWQDADGVTSLDVDCVVRLHGGRLPNLVRLEELALDARDVLLAGGFSPGPLQAPVEDGEANTYTATITVQHRQC
jgi:hypothetical protein